MTTRRFLTLTAAVLAAVTTTATAPGFAAWAATTWS
jgi:hypothetical protein